MNTNQKNIRIYCVSQAAEDGQGNVRLIKASTAAQALRHVASGLFNVQVAGALAVADLVSQGVKVEDVTTEPEAV